MQPGEKFSATFRFSLPFLPTGDYAVEAFVFDGNPSSFVTTSRAVDRCFLHVNSEHVSAGSLANAARQGLGLLTLGIVYAVAGHSCLNWLLYHRDRGLHVASTYSAGAIAALGLGCHIKVGIHFGCFQIEAPWADRCAAWAPLVTLAALALSYSRVLPTLRRAEDLWRGAFALVVALLLTSKVFSPQYMIWLLPLGAMAASTGAKVDRGLGAALMVCFALTAEMFPGETPMANGHLLKQVCLVLRSCILLGLWGRICWGSLRVPSPDWEAIAKQAR